MLNYDLVLKGSHGVMYKSVPSVDWGCLPLLMFQGNWSLYEVLLNTLNHQQPKTFLMMDQTLLLPNFHHDPAPVGTANHLFHFPFPSFSKKDKRQEYFASFYSQMIDCPDRYRVMMEIWE